MRTTRTRTPVGTTAKSGASAGRPPRYAAAASPPPRQSAASPSSGSSRRGLEAGAGQPAAQASRRQHGHGGEGREAGQHQLSSRPTRAAAALEQRRPRGRVGAPPERSVGEPHDGDGEADVAGEVGARLPGEAPPGARRAGRPAARPPPSARRTSPSGREQSSARSTGSESSRRSRITAARARPRPGALRPRSRPAGQSAASAERRGAFGPAQDEAVEAAVQVAQATQLLAHGLDRRERRALGGHEGLSGSALGDVMPAVDAPVCPQ